MWACCPCYRHLIANGSGNQSSREAAHQVRELRCSLGTPARSAYRGECRLVSGRSAAIARHTTGFDAGTGMPRQVRFLRARFPGLEEFVNVVDVKAEEVPVGQP